MVAALLLLGSLSPYWSSAQSMALEVIGSSGGIVASGSHSLTWTVGETNIANGTQGGAYVGAGFHQARKPQLTAVGVFQPLGQAIDFQAYPNPAGAALTVVSSTPGLTLRLFDLLGRPVLSDFHLNGQQQLTLSGLPAGMYVLQVLDDQQHLAGVVRIQHYTE
jgi:hypothetical protein